MAIFPWTGAACARAYLEKAKQDGVKGVFTFVLDQSLNGVPNASDPSWYLQGNDSWQSTYPYTVLAITSGTGLSLLTELSYYSGSMMAAPWGRNLTQEYGNEYLPRIYAQVWSNYNSPSPPTWPFDVGVGCVLFFILVLYVPLSAWFFRKRQVRSFQRRLQRGEIDLEALGIKQTTVPEELINKMPLYTFRVSAEAPDSTKTHDYRVECNQSEDVGSPPAIARSASEMFSSSSQTACPVCLDDFVDDDTKVRELPCKHIFHPECVDLYLRDNSSLCPMCKRAALPLGYCPVKVTYPMVLQERVNRQMQQRQDAIEGTSSTSAARQAYVPRPALSPPIHYTGNRTVSQSTGVPSRGDVEMAVIEQDSQVTLTDDVNRGEIHAVPAEVAVQGPEARRAWHRERLAQQQQEVFNVASENARRVVESRPAWRRVVDRMMPGMA